MTHTTIKHLLEFDPIALAEQLEGRDSKEANDLALILATEHSYIKNQMLDVLDDTKHGDDWTRYLRIVQDLGFMNVLQLPFQGQGLSNKPNSEMFNIWAHPDGMLLCCDTFCTTMLNSAHVYYNWLPLQDDAEGNWQVLSSGHWYQHDLNQDLVWVGDHDAREALRYKITNLRNKGNFLSKWKKQPFMWLLHYIDSKQDGYDFKQINQERIQLLPDWVKNMITM